MNPQIYIAKSSASMYKLTAFGSCLMEEFKKTGDPIFALTIPTKSVVIGRNQNCWKECKIENMKRDNIDLVRRYTGGGAVYVDPGNLLFTFVHDNKQSFSKNYDIVIDSISELTMEKAKIIGRNDICIGDKKISGSAFKQDGNVLLHHGTILVNSKNENLEKYLWPNKLKLQSKGISSNAKRVTNLSDLFPEITVEKLTRELVNSYGRVHNNWEPYFYSSLLDFDNDKEITNRFENYEKYLNQLTGHEFIYNSNPDFTHEIEGRADFGTFQLLLNVSNNKIVFVKYYSDGLDVDLNNKIGEHISKLIIGKEYNVDTFTVLSQMTNHKEIKHIFECVIYRIKSE